MRGIGQFLFALIFSSAVGQSANAQLSQDEINSFRTRLSQCWAPPADMPTSEIVIVTLRTRFKPDGSLLEPPQLISGTPSRYGPALAQSAKNAILHCQPFKMLQPEHYEYWKDIEIKFDPNEMNKSFDPARIKALLDSHQDVPKLAQSESTPPSNRWLRYEISDLKGRGLMVQVFTALIHGMLLFAAAGQLILLIAVITKFSSATHEKIMRGLAATAGLLIYIGASAVGLSIPDLVFNALSTTVPFSVGTIGIIVPSATGVLVAWYVVSYLNSRHPEYNVIGMRILAMIMTFVFFLYCDSYIKTFGEHTKDDLVKLLPNLSFVLSVLLYAIFRYHPYGKEYSAAQSNYDDYTQDENI